MANRNQKHKNNVIRARVLPLVRQGQEFLSAQASVIENGSSRQPVCFANTDKWESCVSYRLFGL